MLTFANAAILAGLAAMALPPLIHFFSRRKIDEQDWAAMQFLAVSKRTRRRIYFEQFLLMLLRMLVIGLLVLALASPRVTSGWFSRLGLSGGERDIVILIDGSASMACQRDGRTAQDAARDWAARLIDQLRPGDRVAIFQARHQPVPVLAGFTSDLDQVRNALELLSIPRGGVDWPGCVQAASRMFDGARARQDIVIVTDLQRAGWADEATLPRWELSGHGGPGGRPRISVANVAIGGEPFNAFLDPIVAARGVASADREVRFRSALRTSGRPPGAGISSVKLEIDGRPSGSIPLGGSAADAVRSIAFAQRFGVGSHLVTLTCEGDEFAGDNSQNFALEVLPAVPVLIVDGSVNGRGEFLRDALAPAKDTSPAFLVKIVPVADFLPELLAADIKGTGTPPRVLVLSNVPSLSAAQNAAVEKFLADGGSVLAALGDTVDAAAWNRVAFRAGQGWLPGRLVEVTAGDASPLPESFVHPAVEVFKEPLPGGLHTASFPQRWRIDLAAGINGITGTAILRLTDREPLLAERGVGRGRAALAVVPLDNSWGTNLAALPDFVRLAHELVYYLAGAKAAERNLSPGQPIVFAPRPAEAPAGVSVQTPDGSTRTVPVREWPLVFAETRDAGAYKLTTATGRVYYYAVRPDAAESILTPCGDEDRQKVADIVPGLQYLNGPDELQSQGADGPQTRDLWWLAILLLLGTLLVELAYTRRLSKAAFAD